MIEYIKTCRPEHWLKNIFIIFGHVVALTIFYQLKFDQSIFYKAILSLIPACLIASANYIINEILDAPFDKLHPTKKHRGAAAGKVNIKILWVLAFILSFLGLAMGYYFFENKMYTLTLIMLLISGVVYNVKPLRFKDKAYLDVIAESFNNPIRLWLGWFAILPDSIYNFPPLSITISWWAFGALLMTGKRYSELIFIGDKQISQNYRASFKKYTEKHLVISMISYANLFCFCAGVAVATYPIIRNLLIVFPFILVAVIFYFNSALSKSGAKLEPEKIIQNIWVVLLLLVISVLSIILLYISKVHNFDIIPYLKIMQWPPKW